MREYSFFNRFLILAVYCERYVCLNSKICKSLVSNWTNMSNFHPREVLCRCSETQLQVDEKLDYLFFFNLAARLNN